MKRIPLTQGYHAIVDDEDYEFLMQWKWHVLIGKSGNVYAMRNSELTEVNGKRHHILMHRVICKTPHSKQTDHRDGDGLNNRRDNLRPATKSQNMHNRKPNAKGASKFKGVSWHKQHRKWCAHIQVNKVRHHIGLFHDEKEAALAYEATAKKEFGLFYRGQL